MRSIFFFLASTFLSLSVAANDSKSFFELVEQRRSEVQFTVGMIFFELKNHQEAAKWVRKSAEQGHAEAQFTLGGMYFWGLGVLKNDQEAVKWYRKAAKQGSAEAQFDLGVMYSLGRGVLKNNLKTYMWGVLAEYNGADSTEIIDTVKPKLNNLQITTAQNMAKRCLDSNYQGCD